MIAKIYNFIWIFSKQLFDESTWIRANIIYNFTSHVSLKVGKFEKKIYDMIIQNIQKEEQMTL